MDKCKEPEKVDEPTHKPNFVKHLNKTRTMSAKQKWEWAFDKILVVSHVLFVSITRLLTIRPYQGLLVQDYYSPFRRERGEVGATSRQ